jgi:PST family polysaccharide transporter
MKKYIFNTSWIILERLLRVALNLFIWGMVAKELGIAEFGRFSYFQALVFLLIPFCTLGIDQIIRNKISNFPESANQYISTGIQIKFYSALLLSVFCILFLIFFDSSIADAKLIIFGLLISLIFRSFGIIEYYFDWKLESRINGFIRSLSFLIVSALYIAALMFDASVYWFGFIYSCEFLICAFFLNVVYKLEAGKINWHINLKFVKELLKAGLPIFMCEIAVCIFLRVNQVFLGNILSSDSVGLYSAAARFSEFWYFIPSSLLASSFSLLTVTHALSKDNFNRYAGLLFEIMLILEIAIITFTYIFSERIILFFFGSHYFESIALLNILILSNTFMFWGIVQEPIDVAKDALYWRFFRVSTGAILSIITSYFFISWFGVIGSAWSVFITFFWTYFLSNLFYKKGQEIFLIQLRSFLFLELLKLLRSRFFKKI